MGGAIASVGTNIWISPVALSRIGECGSSLIGFLLISAGSFMIAQPVFWLTVIGFMLAYQGLALNSSAVAVGAANCTDSSTRSSIMTGTRMFKSLGAVIGPTLSGSLATQGVRQPFEAAG